jgi:hypothetical protein
MILLLIFMMHRGDHDDDDGLLGTGATTILGRGRRRKSLVCRLPHLFVTKNLQ